MKTLKRRLADGIARVYLVQGDDFYLFDKAFLMIKNACKISLEDFNVSVFDDENFSLDKFYETTELMPIIDEKRLIIVKNLKLSENDKKKFNEILLKIPKHTVVVILDYNNNFESLKKDFVFVDANRMDKDTIKKIITSFLIKQGKVIDQEALSTLIDSCNCYLTKIMNELNKLIFYNIEDNVISKQMIDAMVIKDVEFSVFELTEALSKKDGDKAVKILKIVEKDSGIFTLIANQFRRLFYVSLSDLTNTELANLLGVKEYAIIKSRQLAKGFSKAQLKKISTFLEDFDYAVKSGAMLISNALYLLAFNIIYV